MGNSASSLLKRGLAWIIVIAVAILAFKIVIAAIAGFFQILFAIALVVLVGWAVLWAFRHL
jgi:uncharacterized membrane protein